MFATINTNQSATRADASAVVLAKDRNHKPSNLQLEILTKQLKAQNCKVMDVMYWGIQSCRHDRHKPWFQEETSTIDRKIHGSAIVAETVLSPQTIVPTHIKRIAAAWFTLKTLSCRG